jgi:hypothetical protein
MSACASRAALSLTRARRAEVVVVQPVVAVARAAQIKAMLAVVVAREVCVLL